MDSISQFVLGAAVGALVAGPSLGARKAAIIGGVLGTLPDLDVFYPFTNAVDEFVLHRSLTHSLLVHTGFAPLIGALLAKQFRFPAWQSILMVWLVWTTHAMLDSMTVYGTQLLWPYSTHPYGSGSVFIIDPLYTLPLLIFTVIAMFNGDWRRSLERGAITVLVVSTAYLGWSVFAQYIAGYRAGIWLERHGIHATATLTTPTPFNTLFWRTIALDGDDYINVYVPLLGGSSQVHGYRHERVDGPGACALELTEGRRLDEFASSFTRALGQGDVAVISDLRMGVTPNYVFSFAVATIEGSELGEPIRIETARGTTTADLEWLWHGVLGRPGIRQAESQARLVNGQSLNQSRPQASGTPHGADC